MATDIFDFGFTVVDENELEAVQEASEKINQANANSEKLTKLHNAILPLLKNLKNNPEKDYIYWPNRTSKIEQFEKVLENIING